MSPGFSPCDMLFLMRPETYALTAVAYERRRVFQRTANAELLIATMFRYRDQSRFLLHGFVVMPELIHVLMTPAQTIERTAQLIKGGYSFAVRKQFPGEVWQPGYFAHRITSAEDLRSVVGEACPECRDLSPRPIRFQARVTAILAGRWKRAQDGWHDCASDSSSGSGICPRGVLPRARLVSLAAGENVLADDRLGIVDDCLSDAFPFRSMSGRRP